MKRVRLAPEVRSALERRQRARELWGNFNEWLTRHPSPRWVFRGQAQNWALRSSIGRLKRYRPESELLLLNVFKRAALPHISHQKLTSNWDWLAVAQHYGLPTRLIDWTTNPIAAVFFATEASPRGKRDGVVTTVEPNKVRFYRLESEEAPDPFEIDEDGFFYPAALAPRIAAQRGLFSIHPRPQAAWRLRNLRAEFIVPADLKDDLRRILFTIGIDDAQVKADLDGLSATLRWRYESGIPLE